jgi:hypothetical protein
MAQRLAPWPSISERGIPSVIQPTEEQREEVANHFVLGGDGDTSDAVGVYRRSGWAARATLDSHLFAIRWAETIAVQRGYGVC